MTTATPVPSPHHVGSRRPSRRLKAGIASIAAAAVVSALGGCASAAPIAQGDSSSSGTTAVAEPWSYEDSPGQGYGQGGGSRTPEWSTEGGASSTDATPATDAQQVGLVYVRTTLDFGENEAAGTGMVLTSDGEVLTNHHVVEGATAIEVVVAATGKAYAAEVVGYDAATDVALLQLADAAGLETVKTDTDEAVSVGDAVIGVGNAGGEEAATAAAGTITATGASITVADESGGSAQLSNLIEIDADIVSGDSGGPLLDDDGEVVGMNTAASSGDAQITGYAVPIASALAVVDQIETGVESENVEIGGTPFLGVTLNRTASTRSYGRGYRGGASESSPYESAPAGTAPAGSTGEGAVVAGTVDGSAAADAGLTAGDTITALDDMAVTSGDALASAIDGYEVGDKVTLTWTDASGTNHEATVVLGEGPVG